MSLQSTTRADGMPSRVAVASTIAFGLGWLRSFQACASQAAAIFSGWGGSGSGRTSVCTGFGLDMYPQW